MNVLKNKGSSRIIERMFSTAMLAFVASNLATAIGPAVDGIIVGAHYSVDDVAAIGLTSFLLVGYRTVAASVIAKGAHVIASSRIGKGDKEGANRIFSLSVILSLSAAVVLAVLSIVYSEQLAVLAGARKGISRLMEPASDYLRGYCVGLPFFAATTVLTPYLQMDGDYNRVTLSCAVMTIADVLADLFVVKVMHGGLFQIGLATSAGYLASFLVAASHFVFRKSVFRFRPKEIRLAEWREIFSNGMSTGVIKLSNTFSGILINHMLAASFSGGVVAALSVGNQLSKFCFSLWLGAANTLMSFASMFFGEEDQKALRDVQSIALRKGLILTCPAAAAILLFAGPLASVFLRNADETTGRMAAESIRFFALSMPMNVFVYCFQQYLIGAGRKLFSSLYSFILDFAIPVPMTMVFLAALGIGAHGQQSPLSISRPFLSRHYSSFARKVRDFGKRCCCCRKTSARSPGMNYAWKGIPCSTSSESPALRSLSYWKTASRNMTRISSLWRLRRWPETLCSTDSQTDDRIMFRSAFLQKTTN